MMITTTTMVVVMNAQRVVYRVTCCVAYLLVLRDVYRHVFRDVYRHVIRDAYRDVCRDEHADRDVTTGHGILNHMDSHVPTGIKGPFAPLSLKVHQSKKKLHWPVVCVTIRPSRQKRKCQMK